MRDTEKQKWLAPVVRRFRGADEVWEFYKTRGSPQQRAQLRALLEGVEGRGDGRTQCQRHVTVERSRGPIRDD